VSTQHEVERLEQVYRGYQARETVHSLWSKQNIGNQVIVQERNTTLERLLCTNNFLPMANHKILDIGCGSGSLLAGFMNWGALTSNLYGVDLLPERIDAARQQFPDLCFQQGNAEQLNFATSMFDFVMFSTVFSSILNTQMAQNIANEANRILKPSGAIIWYDFRYNNPRNPHVRGMKRTQIQCLFPDFKLQLRTITLLPPLARRLGPLTSIFYPLLACIPFLRTHYLGLLVKPC
jgi:ubiquinone/menaquinone biosynthesis C-methylase UbiE